MILAANNAGQRFAYSNWPAIMAIVEPMGLVVVLSGVRDYLGMRPPFGTSVVVFFATGLVPFYLFFNVSLKVRMLDLRRKLPRTTRFDFALSYLVGELVVKVLMLVGILGTLMLAGADPPLPRDPFGCLVSALVLGLWGFAIGLINMVVTAFWRSWYYFYTVGLRALMLVSSVLYVLDLSPLPLREIAVYNPLAHAITWFRANYYYNYPSALLDMHYLLSVVAVTFVAGVFLDFATRPYRRMQ